MLHTVRPASHDEKNRLGLSQKMSLCGEMVARFLSGHHPREAFLAGFYGEGDSLVFGEERLFGSGRGLAVCGATRETAVCRGGVCGWKRYGATGFQRVLNRFNF